VSETWAKVRRRLRHVAAERQLGSQLERVGAYLESLPPPQDRAQPVLFFNASTRIHRLSLNGAFSLVASWGLRARGASVKTVVCQQGMVQCVLGALWNQPSTPPPCGQCVAYSQKLFASDSVVPLTLDADVAQAVERDLSDLPLEALQAWESDHLPLGELCLPSVRWVLRRHHLADDETTRGLYRRYLASAVSLVGRFQSLLEAEAPRALVIFNGLTYPEAVARAVAEARGIPVVTHEVGLRPFSAFFSHDEATFRQVPLEDGARLSADQGALLDAYLDQRRRGRFSMAGVEFWPDIQELPQAVADAGGENGRLVTVFTNVIFDTSQVHANTLFDDMFDWLGALSHQISRHPETQFVIRAHPDEDRPGKASRESVADWIQAAGWLDLPNVTFFSPSDYVSSYELVKRSRLVLVYSSSIGLEASIQGTPVLCAGRARYTQDPTVILPGSRADYLEALDHLLSTEDISWPESFVQTARAFLFTELFEASLDFSDFLRPYPEAPGMVVLSEFEPKLLTTHPTLDVVQRGLDGQAPFLLNVPAGAGELT